MHLEPQTDPRSGLTGLFVSDEPFGPMVYALLPSRAEASVSYRTNGDRFIHGEVTAPALLDEGWVYTIEAEESEMTKVSDEFILNSPAHVIHVKQVTKDDILKYGWIVNESTNED